MSIIFSEFLKFIESAVFVIILWQMLTFLFVIIELLLIFLFIFADTNYLSTLACGPYGLIFASFIPFFLDIPVTSRFRIFGVNFSDKSFIYLAGLQVSFFFWTEMDTYLSFTLKYFIATTSLLLLAAAFIFWEAFSYSWYLWSDCWFSLSSERAWHPQDEGKFSLIHTILIFLVMSVPLKLYFVVFLLVAWLLGIIFNSIY